MDIIYVCKPSGFQPHYEFIFQVIDGIGCSYFSSNEMFERGEDENPIHDPEVDYYEDLSRSKCILVVWTPETIHSAWMHEKADLGAYRHTLVQIVAGEIETPQEYKKFPIVRLSARPNENDLEISKTLGPILLDVVQRDHSAEIEHDFIEKMRVKYAQAKTTRDWFLSVREFQNYMGSHRNLSAEVKKLYNEFASAYANSARVDKNIKG